MPDLRESLTVAAPADLVYDLVADLPRMGEWSPECERVTWRGETTCAAEGAQFVGHNKAGAVRWMTQGEVVIAEPGRHLAFEITFGPLKIARWEYLIVPDDNDVSTCTVVEEWTDRRPGLYRAPADLALGPRMKTNQRGMLETLANQSVPLRPLQGAKHPHAAGHRPAPRPERAGEPAHAKDVGSSSRCSLVNDRSAPAQPGDREDLLSLSAARRDDHQRRQPLRAGL